MPDGPMELEEKVTCGVTGKGHVLRSRIHRVSCRVASEVMLGGLATKCRMISEDHT